MDPVLLKEGVKRRLETDFTEEAETLVSRNILRSRYNPSGALIGNLMTFLDICLAWLRARTVFFCWGVEGSQSSLVLLQNLDAQKKTS